MIHKPDANAEGQKEIGRILERMGSENIEKVMDLKDAPKGWHAFPIESAKVLETLLSMNRRQRRAFIAERRRGIPEEDALAMAEVVLP